jgi:hypothetical protein
VSDILAVSIDAVDCGDHDGKTLFYALVAPSHAKGFIMTAAMLVLQIIFRGMSVTEGCLPLYVQEEAATSILVPAS